jgi:predicted NAD/FAD-binding protein
VVAYNLELFGGRFHNDAWFAVTWGAFPLVTAYFASAERITAEAVLAGAFAALLSHAQRLLSTPVRDVRRRAASVSGTIVRADGSSTAIDAETLTAAPEQALRALAAAVVVLASALVTFRVT